MSMMDSHVETVEDLLKGIEGEHKGNKARVESDLEEINETLKQMNMEIHTVPSAAKAKYKEKIASFKLRVDAAKKTLLFSGSASAAAAAGGANGGMYAKQQSMEEKQAASLEVLKKSRQQLAETEATGVNTVNELEKQNNQIKKTRENTAEINADLSHSNKLLNKMSQWWRG